MWKQYKQAFQSDAGAMLSAKSHEKKSMKMKWEVNIFKTVIVLAARGSKVSVDVA